MSGTLTATGDSLTFTLDSTETHGTMALETTGAFTYTPDPDVGGVAEVLNFIVTDGMAEQDTGVVTFNIAPINDPPVIDNAPATVETDEVCWFFFFFFFFFFVGSFARFVCDVPFRVVRRPPIWAW